MFKTCGERGFGVVGGGKILGTTTIVSNVGPVMPVGDVSASGGSGDTVMAVGNVGPWDPDGVALDPVDVVGTGVGIVTAVPGATVSVGPSSPLPHAASPTSARAASTLR